MFFFPGLSVSQVVGQNGKKTVKSVRHISACHSSPVSEILTTWMKSDFLNLRTASTKLENLGCFSMI